MDLVCQADPRCLHHGVGELTPSPQALSVSLAAPAIVRSGYDAGLLLELRNVSTVPIALDVDDSCGTFEATASNDKDSSFETDCLGMCGHRPEPHVLRVTLEPGGVVRKHVKFFAVQTRVVLDEHQECTERATGGLGIHLIKKLLSSMTYRREGQRNIVEVTARRKL